MGSEAPPFLLLRSDDFGVYHAVNCISFFHVYCFLEAECHSDSLLIRSDVFGVYHALMCIYLSQVHYSLEVRTYFSKKQTGKRKEDEEENVHQYFICEQSTFSKQGSRPNI